MHPLIDAFINGGSIEKNTARAEQAGQLGDAEQRKTAFLWIFPNDVFLSAYPQVAEEEGEDAKRVADMDGIHMYGLKLGRVRELIKQRVSAMNRRIFDIQIDSSATSIFAGRLCACEPASAYYSLMT